MGGEPETLLPGSDSLLNLKNKLFIYYQQIPPPLGVKHKCVHILYACILSTVCYNWISIDLHSVL